MHCGHVAHFSLRFSIPDKYHEFQFAGNLLSSSKGYCSKTNQQSPTDLEQTAELLQLTEVICLHWYNSTCPDVDWDLREGEVSCYVLGTSNHFSREPRDEGALGGRERAGREEGSEGKKSGR